MSKPFRVWDINAINSTYEDVLQMLAKIEEQCTEHQVPPEALPNSLLPTEVLFNICVCLQHTYDKLLEHELLVAGYPKSTKSTH